MESAEVIDEQGRIKIYITYQDKTVLFSANPKYTFQKTMNNLKKLSNTYPDKYWLLPEIDENSGNRITYFLGKLESKTIFHLKSTEGDDMSLERYGVKAGDKLKLIRKVVAG